MTIQSIVKLLWGDSEEKEIADRELDDVVYSQLCDSQKETFCLDASGFTERNAITHPRRDANQSWGLRHSCLLTLLEMTGNRPVEYNLLLCCVVPENNKYTPYLYFFSLVFLHN